MSSKDIAVGAVGVTDGGIVLAGTLNKTAANLNKPPYLIVFEKNINKNQKFITLDKPEFLNGFIQVKGIFSNLSTEEILKNYAGVLTSTPKELYLEVLIPVHKIEHIINLVFKQK